MAARFFLKRFTSSLDYNYSVFRRFLLLVGMAFTLAGCSWQVSSLGGATATAFIITSTLPPTPIPSATLTPIPPTPSPTTAPIEGMTTTQINVRSEPSTAGTQLGILAPFLKVQILGRDTEAKWYKILYPQGAGGVAWVIAEYINVQNKDAIPVIGGTVSTPAPQGITGTPPAGGTILQQVNVRKGPGTSFDAVGTLNAKETAKITGRDSSGTWLQIQYAAAPEGKGWIAAAYVESADLEALPILGQSTAVAGTGTPTLSSPTASPTAAVAAPDNDSADAPAASVTFSPGGTRALIYSSDLSTPEGDLQDFIAFTPYKGDVLIALSCVGNGTLKVGIGLHGAEMPEWAGLACSETKRLQLSPNQPYLVKLAIISRDSSPAFARYTIRIEDAD
jgi:uncharacterized protein YraI